MITVSNKWSKRSYIKKEIIQTKHTAYRFQIPFLLARECYLCGRDMSTCVGTLAVGWKPIISELLHGLDASLKPWTPDLRDSYSPPTTVSSVPNRSAMTHPSTNGLAPAERPHTYTQQWADQSGKVNHWAAWLLTPGTGDTHSPAYRFQCPFLLDFGYVWDVNTHPCHTSNSNGLA